jgi:hypothetical protein
MSTWNQREQVCACGRRALVRVVESANVWRHPAFRDDVLAERFNQTICVGCEAAVSVEIMVLYTDLEHQLFIGVFPRHEAAAVAACSHIVETSFQAAIGDAPRPVRAWGDSVQRRVVFGYDQLREKVLCSYHGLDDRMVEAYKMLTLTLGARTLEPGTVDLRLVDLRGDEAVYHALDARRRPIRELLVQRSTFEHLARQPVRALMPGLFSSPYVHHTQAVAPTAAS